MLFNNNKLFQMLHLSMRCKMFHKTEFSSEIESNHFQRSYKYHIEYTLFCETVNEFYRIAISYTVFILL